MPLYIPDYIGSLGGHGSTHWGTEKWPTFYRRHFQIPFLAWKVLCFIQTSWKCVHEGRGHNKSALCPVVAWYRTGSKPACYQAIAWTNDGHVSIRIHKSPRLDELNNDCFKTSRHLVVALQLKTSTIYKLNGFLILSQTCRYITVYQMISAYFD